MSDTFSLDIPDLVVPDARRDSDRDYNQPGKAQAEAIAEIEAARPPLDLGSFELDIKTPTPVIKSGEKKVKYVDGNLYEYEIFPLIDCYDKMLRVPSAQFEFDGPNRTPILPRHLAVSLIETMKERWGIGLAAVQCGIPYNVFVMGSEGVGYALFNPKIVDVDGTAKGDEGCLSFPGLFLPITRPANVTVEYQDMNGELKRQTFAGLTARVVLHEYDHLVGKVYTDLVSPIILGRCKGKVKKNLKLLAAQRERIEREQIIKAATNKVVLDKLKQANANHERPWLSEATD